MSDNQNPPQMHAILLTTGMILVGIVMDDGRESGEMIVMSPYVLPATSTIVSALRERDVVISLARLMGLPPDQPMQINRDHVVLMVPHPYVERRSGRVQELGEDRRQELGEDRR